MIFCSECGEKIREDAVFCPNCGNRIRQGRTLIAVPDEKYDEQGETITKPEKIVKKKKGSVPKIVIIVAVIIVLLSVVVGFFVALSINDNVVEDQTVAGKPIHEQREKEEEDKVSLKEIDDEQEDETEKEEIEKEEIEKKEESQQEASKETKGIDNPEGYIIPDSDKRVIDSSDIAGLSLQEINYAKNEIYARHGRIFKSSELQKYFDSKSWYNGTIAPDSFKESMLSSVESANATFLSDTEFGMASGGYQLDK